MLEPARTFFDGRLAFLKKTRHWNSLRQGTPAPTGTQTGVLLLRGRCASGSAQRPFFLGRCCPCQRPAAVAALHTGGESRAARNFDPRCIFDSTKKIFKIPRFIFENSSLLQGASLIEAMQRCPLSNGRLPSKRTTPQLTETAFFISRTSRFAPKKAPPPARPAESAELKTGLSFLPANREVGVRYSHLDAVLEAHVGSPRAV